MEFKKIRYADLNSRRKETYNSQKTSAVLADYGFATIRLFDDWAWADFIAQHIDGKRYLKVQLKSRVSFAKKYQGKDLWIAFPEGKHWYLYPHDPLLDHFLSEFEETTSRRVGEEYTCKTLRGDFRDRIAKHKIKPRPF